MKLMIPVAGLLIALSSPAHAIAHPACVGKDNNLCDTFGLLINLKGMGCYRLMNITPLGGEAYRLTCELASNNRSLITYTLRFIDGNRKYTVD